jgi:hypothetical protein
MSDNELELLNQILEERQAQRTVHVPDDRSFELFANEQVLRDYDLSSDEIEAGAIGGGNDGQIDGVFVFLNGFLVAEDSEVFEDPPSKLRKYPVSTPLLLWLVQAKREQSFSETRSCPQTWCNSSG